MTEPTEKQITFIKKLIAERSHYTEEHYDLASLSREGASKLIDQLLTLPIKKGVESLEPGLYHLPSDKGGPGAIYKVQRSKQGKHLYAKLLMQITGKRLNEKGEEVGFEFAYAPGALKTLKPEQRMTLEQAQAFGIKYGVCCVCGAFLKDATSVKDGIGPVCRKNWFVIAQTQKIPVSKKAEQPMSAASWKSYGVG